MKMWMVLVPVLLLAACGGVEGDIEEAFRQKYEKAICLKLSQPPFSVKSEDILGSSSDWAMVHALEKKGLFTLGEPVQRGGGFASYQQVNVDLTDKGRKFFRDGRLCYGHTQLKKILDYRRNEQNGTIDAEALLQHEFEDWAVQPEFEQFIKKSSSPFSGLPEKPGEEKVADRLVEMEKAGWVIAGTLIEED